MEKILGDWIVYDYTMEEDSEEEVYKISFIYLEAENRLQTKIIKPTNNLFFESEEELEESIFISDDVIFDAEKNEVNFSFETEIGKITTKVKFYSEKLFRAHSFNPIETSIEINYMIGLKKSDFCVSPGSIIFGKFILTEFINNPNNTQQKVCTADLEIKMKTDFNSINPFVFPKLTGKYFNFNSIYEEFNEEFSGKDYLIEGEIYADNHVSFITKFGGPCDCGFEFKINEGNALTGIWCNFNEDGVLNGIKNLEPL